MQRRAEKPLEAGRPAQSRLPDPRWCRLSEPLEEPTSRDDQDRSTGRRCQVAAGPGRPAYARPLGSTLQRLAISLHVEVKHNHHGCIPPALPELTAGN